MRKGTSVKATRDIMRNELYTANGKSGGNDSVVIPKGASGAIVCADGAILDVDFEGRRQLWVKEGDVGPA
jgi:hypothetical protein